jgi:hypothetical protein
LFNIAKGELEHRVVKGRNDRTSKNNAVPQIVKMDVRQQVHDRISNEIHALETNDSSEQSKSDAPDERHHRIAFEEKKWLYLPDWLSENKRDPAFKVS